jgi:prevent-host-death family protein
MKTATAKELRYKAASILENVRKGEEVVITLRGKRVAILSAVEKKSHEFIPIGFGIWKGREEMRDVKKWIDERRKARFRK